MSDLEDIRRRLLAHLYKIQRAHDFHDWMLLTILVTLMFVTNAWAASIYLAGGG